MLGVKHGDSYKASDSGSGYLSAKFKIEPGSFAWFFTSENLDQKPYNLASKVFDSIIQVPQLVQLQNVEMVHIVLVIVEEEHVLIMVV